MAYSSRQHRYLQAMGIPAWERRDAAPAGTPRDTHAAPAADPLAPGDGLQGSVPVAQLDWPALEARVASCRLCALAESRTQTVFGTGDRAASCFVIGEAPGAEEDRRGEPFVGRAGQLLNAMLAAIGLAREQVYIGNILKCRPPRNRDPRPDEVRCCEAHWLRQLELVRPRAILAVGRIAAQNLLDTGVAIGRLRGSVHEYGGARTPLVVTYHPAYLLRSPLEKRKAWEDLNMLRGILAGEPQAQ